MDDVRAVMDAVGSHRAALLGVSEGGPMSIMFAATYPERTRALVLYGSFAVSRLRPIIRVPTLVLDRSGDGAVPVESGRYLASHIPGAKYVVMPGIDHAPAVGDHERIVGEIEEFLTGSRSEVEIDRVLATVL